MSPNKVRPHLIKVNLGVVAINRYSQISIVAELEPHHQMLLSVIYRTSTHLKTIHGFSLLLMAARYTDHFSEDSSNECPGYYIIQSDVRARVMQNLWKMRSTPSLLSLIGLLWSEVVATDWVLSMSQIEFRIPQSSSIPVTSPSDCLMSYLGHSLEWGLTPLLRSSRCILYLQSTGQRRTWK